MKKSALMTFQHRKYSSFLGSLEDRVVRENSVGGDKDLLKQKICANLWSDLTTLAGGRLMAINAAGSQMFFRLLAGWCFEIGVRSFFLLYLNQINSKSLQNAECHYYI